MAGVLAWEARGDCIAMGAVSLDSAAPAREDPPQKRYSPGRAPPAEALVGAAPDAGPMSM
jgi:hypothetical protein